jgi:hypothetical protein
MWLRHRYEVNHESVRPGRLGPHGSGIGRRLRVLGHDGNVCDPMAHAASASVPPTARAADPQHCPSSALQVRTAPGSGEAMDGVYWDLTFTNTGTVTCTLYGYPGVSFLAAGHGAITAPATRVFASPHQVILAPGQTANQATVAFLKVYPPNDAIPVFVSTRIGVCAGRSPGGTVWPVVPDNHADL